MSQNAIAIEWLKAAKLDIENISYIIEVEHLTPICAFHSQQAIEKTLKALIASKDIDIPKIHSLNRLFEICKEQIQNNKPDMVNLLDSLYVESRYPGDIGLLPYGAPTINDAKEFYKFANDVFDEVCLVLGVFVK